MIKYAEFVSVWDGGYEVTTKCRVDTETLEVFNIESSENVDGLDVLEREYVVIDGEEYPCYEKDEACEDEYWYR